jgi:hypothetical protein
MQIELVGGDIMMTLVQDLHVYLLPRPTGYLKTFTADWRRFYREYLRVFRPRFRTRGS